jgi:hypothetical protein
MRNKNFECESQILKQKTRKSTQKLAFFHQIIKFVLFYIMKIGFFWVTNGYLPPLIFKKAYLSP